jgi:homogentisate 1,2-dioxygenase
VASINDLKKQLRRLSEETGQSQSDLAEDTCKKYAKSIFDEKISLYAFVKARSSNHTNWRYSMDTSNYNKLRKASDKKWQ